MTPAGFEPAPFRTGTLIPRLRPLGHGVVFQHPPKRGRSNWYPGEMLQICCILSFRVASRRGCVRLLEMRRKPRREAPGQFEAPDTGVFEDVGRCPPCTHYLPVEVPSHLVVARHLSHHIRRKGRFAKKCVRCRPEHTPRRTALRRRGRRSVPRTTDSSRTVPSPPSPPSHEVP